MKAQVKKLSGIDLHELMCLCSSLQGQMEKFSHVSEFMPQSIKNSIDLYYDELMREQDRREDEL